MEPAALAAGQHSRKEKLHEGGTGNGKEDKLSYENIRRASEAQRKMIADIKALKAQRRQDRRSRFEIIAKKLFEQIVTNNMKSFKKRQYVFDHKSLNILLWDRFVAVGALYSIVFVPMQMVFPELRMMFPDWMAVDVFLDVVFVTDLFVKARTDYTDHGYTVSEPWRVLQRYATTWMAVDILSSVPFDWIVASFTEPSDMVDWSQVMKVLVVFRAARLIRIFEGIEGAAANVIRIIGFMSGFLLIGHWLGLLWHYIAISPIERVSRIADPWNDTMFDPTYMYDEDGKAWLWNLQDEARAHALNGTVIAGGSSEMYFLMTRYICSLYWSLNVMTSLKGIENHETRQCYAESFSVLNPLGERIYTIFVFIMGAIFYSVIYGTIGQYVRMFYASGDRYRRRVDEINEFARFHRLPKSVTKQIRAYVDFAFAVTKGINVDALAHQLPANLQLEIHIHLNKKMVEQVRIFTGFPKDFFNVLVTKLQPCICISGDHVFYAGDVGKRMYFVKRGAVEVRLNDTVIKTLNEGDYFGETALLTSQPRTADICAVCDCMLLSLSKEDLEGVLRAFPVAKGRFEHAVNERLRDLNSKAGTNDGPCVQTGSASPEQQRASLESRSEHSAHGGEEYFESFKSGQSFMSTTPRLGSSPAMVLPNNANGTARSDGIENRRKLSLMHRLESRFATGGKSNRVGDTCGGSSMPWRSGARRRSMEQRDRSPGDSPDSGSRSPSYRRKCSIARAPPQQSSSPKIAQRRRFSIEGSINLNGKDLIVATQPTHELPINQERASDTEVEDVSDLTPRMAVPLPEHAKEVVVNSSSSHNRQDSFRDRDRRDSFRDRESRADDAALAAVMQVGQQEAAATKSAKEGGGLVRFFRRGSIRRGSTTTIDQQPAPASPQGERRRRRSLLKGSEDYGEGERKRRNSVRRNSDAGDATEGEKHLSHLLRVVQSDGSRTRDDVFTLSNKVEEMMNSLDEMNRMIREMRQFQQRSGPIGAARE